MNRGLIAALTCVLSGGAITANAQATWLTPSFDTAVVYDDNVFNRPSAESDQVVRFSPRLDLAHHTERLSMSGRLELDADRFARHQELTTAHAREDAAIDVRYASSARLSLADTAEFVDTETPADLNQLTALAPGRARAQRFVMHPSATYSLGPRLEGTLGYVLSADRLRGGAGVTTQTASASLVRDLSARDRLRVEYLEQHFRFSASAGQASRAMTLEWTHHIDRGITVTVQAGPRVTAGVLAPELGASAARTLRSGSLSLSYQETQTTLIGLAGIARVRSVTAAFERRAGSTLTVHAMSGLVQTRETVAPSVAYRAAGGCDWTLTRHLTFAGSYDTDLQQGNPYATVAGAIIRRNVVTLKLVVADTATAGAGR